MIWFGLYLIVMSAFLLWWKSAHYRTPEEEMRDRDNEERYWRERHNENST